MKDYLVKIFNYNHWANELILEEMAKNDVNDEYCTKLMSHMLNAQRTWYNRITKVVNENNDIWQIHPFEKLSEKNNALTELYVKMLAKTKLSELNKKLENKNMSGEVFFNSLTDILIHVANHGSHHRAQISKRLRELGVTPPKIDYITYVRTFPDFW